MIRENLMVRENFMRKHSQTLNIPEEMYKGFTHPLYDGNPFRGDETKDEVLQVIIRSALNDCLLVGEHCLYYFAMDKFPEYELNHIIVEYICRDEYAYKYIGVWDGIRIVHPKTGEVLASYNWAKDNPFKGDETKDEVLQIIMRSALNDCLLVSEHCLYYFAMDKFPEYELDHIVVDYICRDEYIYNTDIWGGIRILHSETGEVLASYNWD